MNEASLLGRYMANRLSSVFLATAFVGSLLAVACGDDDTNAGGDAGEPGFSGSPGEAGAGGSSVAGSSVGGQGATGGQNDAGGGQAGEVGLGGSAGEGGAAGSAGAAGAATNEGGAGGSPDVELVYACGQTTIVHKLCSAGTSLNCADATECADCVGDQNGYRADFAECAVCLAAYDKSLQCGVDAFEAGDAAAGMECFEVDGAQLNDACGSLQFSALDCIDYLAVNEKCPEKWPLDPP